MESGEVVRKIKRIILEEFSKRGVDVEEILLFGSRARGDFRKDSDWDVLVVISREIDRKNTENCGTVFTDVLTSPSTS